MYEVLVFYKFDSAGTNTLHNYVYDHPQQSLRDIRGTRGRSSLSFKLGVISQRFSSDILIMVEWCVLRIRSPNSFPRSFLYLLNLNVVYTFIRYPLSFPHIKQHKTSKFCFSSFINIYLVSYKQILNFNNSPYLLKTEIKKYFQHFFNELHSFGNRNVSLKLREDCSFRFINSEGRQVNEVGEE